MKTNKKQKFLPWILILAIVFSLAPSVEGFAQKIEDVNVDFPERQQDMKIAEDIVKAYESGNWENLRNNVKEDVFFYNLGISDSLNIDQTIAYWKKGRDIAVPSISEDGVWLPVEVKSGPRKGEWVLHWGYNTLSYHNGETISFPYHVAFKFDGDKINQAYFYYDNNRIIRALGYDIQPPLKEYDQKENEFPFPENPED